MFCGVMLVNFDSKGCLVVLMCYCEGLIEDVVG